MRILPVAAALVICQVGLGCSVDGLGLRAGDSGMPDDVAPTRFPELVLPGIRSAATVDTAAVVSSAEFYDPERARYDLLHVMGIFFWCSHCNKETDDVVKLTAWQVEHRVAVLQIAMQGYGGDTPAWPELQKWVTAKNVGFPVVIDDHGALLGQYFPVNAVPLNVVVDPASMDVLAVDIGEVGDVRAYEQKYLARRAD